jgi:pyruvate formate lyase activating enzyme
MKTPVANETQAYMLDQHTVAAPPVLWHPEADGVRCVACGHRCLIKEGKRGICKVRSNDAGQLRVPWGYVGALQCDPVEKKPFFHVHPSTDALTFGMLGCDYHCAYCQNWFTSQALRDQSSSALPKPVSPTQLVEIALRERARLIVSSYNEPLITAEWAVAVFREARETGLLCAFVSNGNATPEALDHLAPWIQAYKVDLKGFDDRHYRTLGGTLQAVLDTIRGLHERGIWLEIVTLLVPGFNDSDDEIRRLTEFVASVSVDIPWHVTAFHSDYKMGDNPDTQTEQLIRAAEMGRDAGLRFVYAGNRPAQVGGWENTYCPGCGETLIERYGYLVSSYCITASGSCPSCDRAMPGIWPTRPDEVRTGDPALMALRRPRPV